MPKVPDRPSKTRRIIRYAEHMLPGNETTTGVVVATLGGRSITTRQVGSVFRALPYMQIIKLSDGRSKWRRLDDG